ncbi:hypothetical protein P8452_33498 [Trifolium repens]|nr:hypothetical protein P8452_33498 [Trifolium repens]
MNVRYNKVSKKIKLGENSQNLGLRKSKILFCTHTKNKKFMDSSNDMDDSGSIHEFIEVDKFKDDVGCWEPAAEMCFSSADDVKSFYQEYALRKGFGWRIRSSKKGKDGEVCYMILACSREGSTVSKVPCTLKTLPTKANKCPARICIKMEVAGLGWVVCYRVIALWLAEEETEHPLSFSAAALSVQSHRHIID